MIYLIMVINLCIFGMEEGEGSQCVWVVFDDQVFLWFEILVQRLNSVLKFGILVLIFVFIIVGKENVGEMLGVLKFFWVRVQLIWFFIFY